MGLIDLHVHSDASDGSFPPAQVVALAKEAGLKAMALTDHDTTAGIPEALKAGEESGIEVIPGIEVSSHYEGHEIHILGLFVDPSDQGLADFLQEMRSRRGFRHFPRGVARPPGLPQRGNASQAGSGRHFIHSLRALREQP